MFAERAIKNMEEMQADLSNLVYSRLNEFHLNDQYCNVTIHVEDESFKCHRFTLGATSEYFHAMFNIKESHAEHVTIRENKYLRLSLVEELCVKYIREMTYIPN